MLCAPSSSASRNVMFFLPSVILTVVINAFVRPYAHRIFYTGYVATVRRC